MEPSYFLRAEHNDNIYLSTEGNELAVSGGTFSPAMKAIMEAEDQLFVADVDLQLIRYKEHSELDSDEGNAGLSWHKATELSTYGLAANYSIQSSLDPRIEFSGIIDQKVGVKTANISPTWQYHFGELWNFMANLSYTDVLYDEPSYSGIYGLKPVNLVNYTESSANLTISRNLTEKDDLSMTLYQSRYKGMSNGLSFSQFVPVFIYLYVEASERKLEYDYKVMQVGYEHKFDNYKSFAVQLGKGETTIQNQTRLHLFNDTGYEISLGDWSAPVESERKSQVYNVSYKQKNEISHIELNASRNRVAVATGGLDETDMAKIHYASGITERLSWSMDINHEVHKPDQDTNVQSILAYTRNNISPIFHYVLDKDWSMSLGYSYSQKSVDSEILSRDSNRVFFTMTWREPKLLSSN